LNNGYPDVLLHALSRSFHFLPAMYIDRSHAVTANLNAVPARVSSDDLDC
jgi:hypothetical protein